MVRQRPEQCWNLERPAGMARTGRNEQGKLPIEPHDRLMKRMLQAMLSVGPCSCDVGPGPPMAT